MIWIRCGLIRKKILTIDLERDSFDFKKISKRKDNIQ